MTAGQGTVSRTFSYAVGGGRTASALFQQQKIRVLLGRSVDITLGGEGRPIVGRLAVPEEVAKDFDFSRVGTVQVIPVDRRGRALFNTTVGAGLVDSDGRFHIDDVPAGPYRLSADLSFGTPRVANRNGPQVGHVFYDFAVPEISDGRSDEALDLGTIGAQIAPQTCGR